MFIEMKLAELCKFVVTRSRYNILILEVNVCVDSHKSSQGCSFLLRSVQIFIIVILIQGSTAAWQWTSPSRESSPITFSPSMCPAVCSSSFPGWLLFILFYRIYTLIIHQHRCAMMQDSLLAKEFSSVIEHLHHYSHYFNVGTLSSLNILYFLSHAVVGWCPKTLLLLLKQKRIFFLLPK